MARIRTVKPEHWSDKELTNISLPAHLLWIATWNFSDDEGVFENDPVLIKSNVFPRRTDVRVEQVSQWIDQLVKARFIVPFEYKNESYFIHRTFKTHQRIDKPQKSKIPESLLKSLFQEHSKNDPIIVVPVKDSKGEELESSVREANANFEKIFSEIISSITWQEAIAMQMKKGILYVGEKLFEFLNELKIKDDYHKGVSEIKKHFINWLKIQIEKEKNCAKKENGKSTTENRNDRVKSVTDLKNKAIEILDHLESKNSDPGA